MKKLIFPLLILSISYTDQKIERKPFVLEKVSLATYRDSYERNLTLLAHDSMAGRWLQAEGLAKTEKFMINKFKAIGLLSIEQFPEYSHSFTFATTNINSNSLKANNLLINPDKYLFIPSTPTVKLDQNSILHVTSFNETDPLDIQISKHLDSSKPGENHIVFVPEHFQDELNLFKSYVIGQGVFRPNIKLGIGKYFMEYSKNNILYFIGNEIKPLSIELNFTLEQRVFKNIVGVLPGKSKPSEYIIFSAHMDHLGIAGLGDDKIYNGANDNASGVAAIITLAQFFLKEKNNERSIIFIAFSLEERGLLGSEEFVKTFNEIKNVIAVLNIDMIGNISPMGEGNAYLSGQGHSNLLPLLQKSLSPTNYILYGEPSGVNYFSNSDNYHFFKKGIVAHSITTFATDDTHYHSTSDKVSTINFNSAFGIVETIAQGSLLIVAGEQTPALKQL